VSPRASPPPARAPTSGDVALCVSLLLDSLLPLALAPVRAALAPADTPLAVLCAARHATLFYAAAFAALLAPHALPGEAAADPGAPGAPTAAAASAAAVSARVSSRFLTAMEALCESLRARVDAAMLGRLQKATAGRIALLPPSAAAIGPAAGTSAAEPAVIGGAPLPALTPSLAAPPPFAHCLSSLRIALGALEAAPRAAFPPAAAAPRRADGAELTALQPPAPEAEAGALVARTVSPLLRFAELLAREGEVSAAAAAAAAVAPAPTGASAAGGGTVSGAPVLAAASSRPLTPAEAAVLQSNCLCLITAALDGAPAAAAVRAQAFKTLTRCAAAIAAEETAVALRVSGLAGPVAEAEAWRLSLRSGGPDGGSGADTQPLATRPGMSAAELQQTLQAFAAKLPLARASAGADISGGESDVDAESGTDDIGGESSGAAARSVAAVAAAASAAAGLLPLSYAARLTDTGVRARVKAAAARALLARYRALHAAVTDPAAGYGDGSDAARQELFVVSPSELAAALLCE
jgi:hypothetical protein